MNYNDASLIITPNGVKAGKLYALKGEDLNVVRATSATRVNASGLIETVGANVPRLDYSNGSCPSILVEPQRTNLLTYSSSFDNAAWVKNQGSIVITPNYSISPSGVQDAERIQFPDGASQISQAYSITNHTASVYIKGIAGETINVGFIGGVGNITTLSGEWQRIVTSGTAGNSLFIGTWGSTARDIQIWGAQLEAGSYATSYIPTTSASVTRNADVISKTGISSLIGQTEGTVFLDFDFNYSDSATQVLLKFNQSNDSNSVGIEVQNNILKALVNSSSSNIANITNTISIGRIKCAIAYKSNDIVFYVNGSLVGTDTSGTINFAGNVDMITLGHFNLLGSLFFQSSRPFNSALLFKTRLSNTELAKLTTI